MAKCTDVPELFGICYKLYGTISLVYSFTDTPFELLVLSLATPLRPPTHTGAIGLAPVTHAGHPRPPPPKIMSRISPMHEREVQSEDNTHRDVAAGSDHDGGHPASTAMPFQ